MKLTRYVYLPRGHVGGRKLFIKSFLPPNPHLSKIFGWGEGKYIQPEDRCRYVIFTMFIGVFVLAALDMLILGGETMRRMLK
jgi:hypothetical protein